MSTEEQVLVMFDEARSVYSELRTMVRVFCLHWSFVESTLSSSLLCSTWASAASLHSACASALARGFALTVEKGKDGRII
jgi:superfamily I DNA and RNA helicase